MSSDWVLKFKKENIKSDSYSKPDTKASKGTIPEQAKEIETGESRISYWCG